MPNQAPTLPDQATARQIVLQGVHKRAFLHRMAELGHQPQTVKEAEALVELGLKMAAAESDPLLKQASEPAPGPYAFANQALDQFLGLGKQAEAVPGLDDVSIQGAFELAQDPAIYGAALVLKQANDAAAAGVGQEEAPAEATEEG
jgi:hypothetical protein